MRDILLIHCIYSPGVALRVPEGQSNPKVGKLEIASGSSPLAMTNKVNCYDSLYFDSESGLSGSHAGDKISSIWRHEIDSGMAIILCYV